MHTETMDAGAPLFIDGAEIRGTETAVHNPARLSEQVGTFEQASKNAAEAAVGSAHRAFPGWAKLPAVERARMLRAGTEDIQTRLADLATLLTREHGKILADATSEVTNAVKTLRYYAELSEYIDREERIDDHRGRVIERRVPMGVVAVIVPWNYPVLLATLMLAPALMAGNTVVVKLPNYAPLALSQVLRSLARQLPPGVLNVLAGTGREIGVHLTTHPKVRKVSFTGSTATGRTIMRDASVNLKNLSLELGGNDPAIVLESASVDDRLVSGLVRGAFTTAGQVCYAPKRLYVHRSKYTEFIDAFATMAGTIRIGEGINSAVTMGPLNNRQQYDTVLNLIETSRREKAHVQEVGELVGSDVTDGYFIRPTIVTGVTHDSPLVREEQFGPVVPIIPFDTEDEAIQLANDSEYGLAASLWSQDVEHAFRLARHIQAGSVFVNIHRVGASDSSMPFGGFKQSGIGRGHGEIALDEASELQILADRVDMR